MISISLALQAAEVQVYLTEVESDEKGSACVSFSQTNKLTSNAHFLRQSLPC